MSLTFSLLLCSLAVRLLYFLDITFDSVHSSLCFLIQRWHWRSTSHKLKSKCRLQCCVPPHRVSKTSVSKCQNSLSPVNIKLNEIYHYNIHIFIKLQTHANVFVFDAVFTTAVISFQHKKSHCHVESGSSTWCVWTAHEMSSSSLKEPERKSTQHVFLSAEVETISQGQGQWRFQYGKCR